MDAYDGCMMRRMRNQALFRRTDARSSEDSDIGRCGPGYAANASSVLLSYVHIVCCAHMSHICVCALSVALCECVLSLLLFVVSRGLSPSPSLRLDHKTHIPYMLTADAQPLRGGLPERGLVPIIRGCM